MDLLCCESNLDCRAHSDPVLLGDDRVLKNLLKTEEFYTINSSYFHCVQNEITPHMRKIVAEWMLELCVEEKCGDDVYPLAINYMDRFLSVCPVAKRDLQLLGTTCLFIASKLREPEPLDAITLVGYTDNSIDLHQLLQWELMVSVKLKWDLSAVTAHDFIRHIVHRLPIKLPFEKIKDHAHTFIALCAREYKFSMCPPSLIAGGSLLAAIHGLQRSYTSLQDNVHRLHLLLGIEKDYLYNCFKQIEDMIAETMEGFVNVYVGEMSDHPEKSGTPTDVRDINF